MTLAEIRTKYLEFFKKRGHAVIPSASLVPQNDPTTLFTGSGMQPMVPYLLGKNHPAGKRIADSQKAFRTADIEEVGDNRHTTLFEMLGNWSLGDYFKKEQLLWCFEFLTETLKLDPHRLYVTVFIGDDKNNLPRDTESVEMWKELFAKKNIEAKEAVMGSEANGYNRGMKEGERIFFYDAKKNWWSRAGVPENMPVGEPGGPDSEVFYEFIDVPHNKKFGAHCHPNCDCGRFLEIGNSVFMQYVKNQDGSFGLLPKQNVDFGGGLERLAMATEKNPDIIAVCHRPILEVLERISGKRYGESPEQTRAFRIIADHMKAAVFLIGDGVFPSNTDQGYFVRRLIRRSVQYADRLGIEKSELASAAKSVAGMYEDAYPELKEKQKNIAETIALEEERFRATLSRGLREFEKLSQKNISGHDAFLLFSTFGFPFEMTKELAAEKGIGINEADFELEMAKHQKLSRAGSEQKFKGGLADASEQTTKLHTATHLMLAGLRKYLGNHIHQAGSNITAERTRFDFTHPEKVPREILDKVEAYVNEAIAKKCDVVIEQIPKEQARADGVEGSFWEKYPEVVNVYMVKCLDGSVYSRELCGGPHVTNTAGMGTFKILKEEASSAGIRRVKATLRVIPAH